MRGLGWVCAGLAAVMAGDVLAADCKDEVVAAFDKQRKSPAFRVNMAQPTAEGPVEVTVDYQPPSKMLQTVTGGNMPGEQQTLLDGDHAYSGNNGTWEELLPQFTQSIVAEFRTAVGQAPQILGEFECLGKTQFEGKEYLGYRTKLTDEQIKSAGNAGTVTRTLYVDPAKGLPAFNVVAALKSDTPPVMKAVYSYPTDVVIEAPKNAPVQKVR
jgi:hypothetical protein